MNRKQHRISQIIHRVKARASQSVWFLFAFILLADFSHREAMALQVQKMNLEKIAEQAHRIVVGKVLSAIESTIPAPGGGSIPITEYTLAVSDALKGKVGRTLTIRQVRLGNGVSALSGQGQGQGSGLPSYGVDEKVVLFLTGESQLGLSSPVGAMQGAFRVQNDHGGQPLSVVNGADNVGLLEGMDQGPTGRLKAMDHTSGLGKMDRPDRGGKGPVSYAEFIAVVKEMIKKKPVH